MKKSISLLMTVLIILSTLLIPSVATYNNIGLPASENAEYSVEMVEKDLETNIVEKKIYSGDANGNENVNTVETWTDIASNVIIEPETFGVASIISTNENSDDRTEVSNTHVFPYSAIAYLELDFLYETYRGTGFLIADNILLTAGHCLYDEEKGGWVKSIVIKPGRKGFLSMPFGLAESKRVSVAALWKENKDSNYDWGMISTYHSFVGNPGHFNISKVANFSTTNVEISGYPKYIGASESNVVYKQYKQNGSAYAYNDNLLIYQITASKGQSGAPIFDNNNTAIGIHSRGGTNYNYGIRLTDENIRTINKFVSNYD